MLIAGSETTRNLIANLIIALGLNQQLQAHIRENPALIPDFIDEVLRNNGLFHTNMLRFVYDDVIIGDTLFQTDEIFLISILSANHDF